MLVGSNLLSPAVFAVLPVCQYVFGRCSYYEKNPERNERFIEIKAATV